MFENKKILILGFARSGYEAAKLLAKRGNEVILNDAAEKHDEDKIAELEELGVQIILGSHPDELMDKSINYLIKNPGVPIDHKYVLKAKELGIEVINEAEMAYRLLPNNIKLIGITGTNGKTTTTAIIYELIKVSGKRAHLTGNIGFPLCAFLDKIEENDIVIMEVSCQQLENFKEFKPDIAVITNICEAHLEFFPSYEYYKSLKAKILQNQTNKEVAIVNLSDDELIDLVKDAKSTMKYFSSKNVINGCYIKEESIYYYNEKIIKLEDIKLVGTHNYENIMAAIMVAKELGVENKDILPVLKEFKGVEHRLEFVRECENRKFYNDSKATNIESTKIALASFKEPIIIIMGGLERNQNFYELKEYIHSVKAIVCYGENKNRIKKFGDDTGIDTVVVNNLSEAVDKAYQLSQEFDIILLSTASASWDMYKCFEDRGNEFKVKVNNIGN